MSGLDQYSETLSRPDNNLAASFLDFAKASQPICRLAMLLCSVVVFAGCSISKLPDYAAPSVTYVTEQEMDLSDVIGYRQLTRGDFRGKEPPSNFDERMAAVTCVYTQPIVDKDSVEIVPLASDYGEQVFEVIFHNLRYRALMNRKCSWWNDRISGLGDDYVLEHEQIHFALFEAAAREWNREPPLRVRVKSQGRDAMKLEVKAQFEAKMQRRLDMLRAENLRFDEDTSVGRNPTRQKKWLQEVMARLGNNADVAVVDAPGLCEIDSSTRKTIEQARAAMLNAAERTAVEELLNEAEAAAGPPECDKVRAGILADKALEMTIR